MCSKASPRLNCWRAARSLVLSLWHTNMQAHTHTHTHTRTRAVSPLAYLGRNYEEISMMLPFGNLHTSRDIRGWSMSWFTVHVRGCRALTDDITTVFTVSIKSAVDKHFCFCLSNMHLFSVTKRKTCPCVWHFKWYWIFFFLVLSAEISPPRSHISDCRFNLAICRKGMKCSVTYCWYAVHN